MNDLYVYGIWSGSEYWCRVYTYEQGKFSLLGCLLANGQINKGPEGNPVYITRSQMQEALDGLATKYKGILHLAREKGSWADCPEVPDDTLKVSGENVEGQNSFHSIPMIIYGRGLSWYEKTEQS